MPQDYDPCVCAREQVGTSGQDRENSENWASNKAVAFAHVEFPAILADGGDDRLVLNAKGVNKYHCRPEVSSSAPRKLGVGRASRAQHVSRSTRESLEHRSRALTHQLTNSSF